MLKTGPVVLKKVVTPQAYNHFLILHFAVSICITDKFKSYLNYADLLFRNFVEQYAIIYGEENITYNIHNLIHVVADVKLYGPLDLYSTFTFESKLGRLKKLIRTGNKPLQQVSKRIYERQEHELKNLGNMFQNVPQLKCERAAGAEKTYAQMNLNGIRYDLTQKNFWFLSKMNEIVKIEYFAMRDNTTVIFGSCLRTKKKKNLFDNPISSDKLLISVFPTIDLKPQQEFKIHDILFKMFYIQINTDHIFLPIYND